MKVMIVQ